MMDLSAARHRAKYVARRLAYRASRTLGIDAGDRLGDYRTVLALAQSERVRYTGEPDGDRRVLFFTMQGGMLQFVSFELALRALLRERGIGSDMVVCDRFLDGCALKNEAQSPEMEASVCAACYRRGADAVAATGSPMLRASETLDAEARAWLGEVEPQAEAMPYAKLVAWEVDAVPIGQIAEAAALRYLRLGSIERAPTEAERAVLLRYVRSSLRTQAVAESLLRRGRPEFAVLTHGIYESWAPILAVLRREGVPALVYDQSSVYREAYVAAWDAITHCPDLDATFREEADAPLSAEETAELRDYLQSRRANTRDRFKYNHAPAESGDALRARLGVPAGAVCFAMFTNLLWDAATVGRDVCFPSQAEWIRRTVAYFAEHPDRYLLLRTHPAERSRGTKQSVEDVVRAAFPELPANVMFASDPSINAYSVYDAIDAGIVNTSTAGLELALLGTPVVVASAAHYAKKGFTADPDSDADYFAALDAVGRGDRLSEPQVRDAERYAHLFWFRYHYKLPLVREAAGGGVEAVALDALSADEQARLGAWLDAVLARRPVLAPRAPAGAGVGP